ncbi:putative addiction module component, TIGR02574 family [Candidatus Electrothrix marina]|uniref:Putative addiction module component, TIGR02574 family n=1 Tax=Candidatus Electrothrix marina TaxID=1859130 RepID=A0A444JGT0_9BACT|nr:putative addiction module component, TIGR02574 family [Candidatus Electrothrix marina]
MNTESIFNLSPPEKLQLVEDLWDDLAAEPSDVPIHEWQAKELNRRRENLINNPASSLTWEDIKAKVRGHHGR